MAPNEPLLSALDSAYAVFARYPRPKVLEAAPTRDGIAILRTLCSAPLRELKGEQIGPYSGWAMTTVGSAENYKHFLPRILEQSVRAPEWMGTEPAILGERLKMAGWPSWAPKERMAVVQIYSLAWLQASTSHPDEGDASDWLCGLGVLGEDIAPALEKWLSPSLPNAVLQVARFMLSAEEVLVEGIGSWSYVDERTRSRVLTWLFSDNVRNALLGAADQVPVEDARLIDKALEALTLAMRSN